MPYISNSLEWIPILIEWQAENYLVVSLLTVVSYDYLLSLSQEKTSLAKLDQEELIWKRGLSLLTCLYVFLRYVGILVPMYVMKQTIHFMIANAPSIPSLHQNISWLVSFQLSFYTRLIPTYGNVSQEAILLGIRGCATLNQPNPLSWIWLILSNGRLKGLIVLLLGQGIFYFIWLFTDEILSISYGLLSLGTTTENTLAAITLAMEIGIICMMGPWLILSIRQNHLTRLNGESTQTTGHTVSTVAFENPPSTLNGPDIPTNEDISQMERSEP
ncbi:hypothetical protein CONPUDRAFT_75484 [Coniophora puteana RWD-64-598 SS2]|uniref:DUF6533 domain-containing protein n=1 Tax=Coniophora puteana (strain RWD-64-598) TaxID=741705 RepID=A0A5M3MGB2_CONPW|nr:uncharacterized protein CONPUDRAFT_75484 [Coniophora puteana RWD-64-598 SS2]EIW77655.1 hypothetical protein CONPUDRAFT_75484 [Coniophora puteana RWD-64-598 SS2]